jgi:hypothetical protein
MHSLITLFTPKGQRRGPRQLVRVDEPQTPRHAVPKPTIDWFVTPEYDSCPEVDAIGWDLLSLRQAPVDTTPRETLADCGTPDPETAVA